MADKTSPSLGERLQALATSINEELSPAMPEEDLQPMVKMVFDLREASRIVLAESEPRQRIEAVVAFARRHEEEVKPHCESGLPNDIARAQGEANAFSLMRELLEEPLPGAETPEAVRLQLADLLLDARRQLLQKIAIETREPAREVLSQADELLEEVFESFAPERWAEELKEAERKRADSQ